MAKHRFGAGVISGCLLLVCSTTLHAQVLRRSYVPPRAEPPQPQPSASFRDRVDGSAVEARLDDPDLDVRLAALVRLGKSGGNRGVDRLVQQLDHPDALATANERLAVVRALAEHTARAKVRQALLRAISSAGDERRTELDDMARYTAALALARSGQADSLEMLGKIIHQDSFGAEVTRSALAAFPPRDSAIVTSSRGAASTSYIRLLGDLGDQRSFFTLREIIRGGAATQRALAAVELTRLGAFEAVPLAKQWYKQSAAVSQGDRTADDTVLLEAAARILTLSRDTQYRKAIDSLLDSDSWPLGVELALIAPHASLVKRLEARLTKTDGDARLDVIAAIGACGGARAAKLLTSLLTQAPAPTPDPDQERKPSSHVTPASAVAATSGAPVSVAPSSDEPSGDEPSGDAAAAALAFSRGNDDVSLEHLSSLLDKPRTRAIAARAAALRATLGGGEAAGLHQTLLQLLVSKSPAERGAGAFGLALESDARAIELLGRKDSAVVAAAARTALGRPAVLRAAARRLAAEERRSLRPALAIALLDLSAAALVPTNVLLDLVQSGSAAMYVAAYALAGRDDSTLRPELERWLASGNPMLRSSVALGLGQSQQPSALGLLESAFRFEADVSVRRSIVLAVGSRSEPTRSRALELAANLDPDARVRQAARRLFKQAGTPAQSGRSTAWLELSGGRGVLSLTTTTTPAIPLIPDADGQCPVVGLPEGGIQISATPHPSRARL